MHTLFDHVCFILLEKGVDGATLLSVDVHLFGMYPTKLIVVMIITVCIYS